jgi:hypothetical protein
MNEGSAGDCRSLFIWTGLGSSHSSPAKAKGFRLNLPVVSLAEFLEWFQSFRFVARVAKPTEREAEDAGSVS